ncbi:transposase [Neisseriaceae bacterium CLB008]
MSNESEIQRWTAKRKAELVKEIIKGKTNIAEAARTHDLTPAAVKKLDKMHAAYGEAMLQILFLKK